MCQWRLGILAAVSQWNRNRSSQLNSSGRYNLCVLLWRLPLGRFRSVYKLGCIHFTRQPKPLYHRPIVFSRFSLDWHLSIAFNQLAADSVRDALWFESQRDRGSKDFKRENPLRLSCWSNSIQKWLFFLPRVFLFTFCEKPFFLSVLRVFFSLICRLGYHHFYFA